MNRADRERLIEFLRKKMCSPCRAGAVDASHPGCREAADLIRIVELEGE